MKNHLFLINCKTHKIKSNKILNYDFSMLCCFILTAVMIRESNPMLLYKEENTSSSSIIDLYSSVTKILCMSVASNVSYSSACPCFTNGSSLSAAQELVSSPQLSIRGDKFLSALSKLGSLVRRILYPFSHI